MSVAFTEEQRAAVFARGRVIVSASAGSGKTFVMIERLVSLIAEGQAEVKNILCVTFTNKAATQMRERLRTALFKRLNESLSESERARIKAQLSDLPLADISTIHSFCGRLLRSRFYQTELDPMFRIVGSDDAVAKELSRRALDETFENAYARSDEAFKELLAVYYYKKKDARLRSLVIALHEKACESGDCAGTLMRVGREDVFPFACEKIASRYREQAQKIKTRALEAKEYFQALPRAQKAAVEIVAACEALIGAEGLFCMRALEKPAISSMPPSTKLEGRDLIMLKRLSACSAGVKELYKSLLKIEEEESERARCDTALRRTSYLAELALLYDEAYMRMKREKGVLDYGDLERFAIAVLSNEQTQKELREKYKFIFVDEYQDVNPVQEKLLSLLSGDEVFLVGDAKQAIYGFRGSRSEYFIKKTGEFQALPLNRNFRSAVAVLECVNRVFAPVVEGYEPMTGGDRYHGFEGGVFFHEIPEEEEKEQIERGVYSVAEGSERRTSDALAEQTVRLVEAEKGKPFYDADLGKERAVDWGDIAVLVRKNTGDAERIVEAAAGRSVPVSTSSEVNVCEFFEARLLIDWLSFLDNDRQDIPRGTAMLSRIGGFQNAELCKIRLRFPSPFTFREACEKYGRFMNDDIAAKLRAFEQNRARLSALARVYSAAEMINTLLAEGLEMQIALKGSVKARLARVRRLVAEAENEGVHEFLKRLKSLDYKVKFAQSGGENTVKVYTMHATKGLEYPVVILAGLDSPFHRTDKDEIMWTDELLAVPKSYDLKSKTYGENLLRTAARITEREKQICEEKNLLYVAMTRARYRLHMLVKKREERSAPDEANCFADFLDYDALADYFVTDGELPPSPARRALVADCDERLKEEILSLYRKEYDFGAQTRLPVKSSATELLHAEAAEEIKTGGRKGFGTEEGVAYHAFLEHVQFGKSASAELERMARAGLLSEAQLKILNVEQLEKILSIPSLCSLQGKRLRREQTFLMRLPAREMNVADADDEIIFQGAIDLLVEDEDGFTVIDYKYSGRSDEQIKKHYAVQIELYKKAVARAMRVSEESIRARIINIALAREIVL